MRMERVIAFASFAFKARGVLGLLILPTRLLIASRMAREGARGRKFAKLMTDHVFSYEDWNVLVAIVHLEGEPNKLRKNG